MLLQLPTFDISFGICYYVLDLYESALDNRQKCVSGPDYDDITVVKYDSIGVFY